MAPILARHLRNGIEESVHRGDIVETDIAGRIIRQLGDPDRLVTLRSTVKPFGALALIEAGGIAAFDLEPAEIAILASSHSGEDLHVRTLQAIFRRSGVSQFALRVALRLQSPTESDALLGVPAAAGLADDRALFRDADWPHEQVEKFKPYSTTSLYAFAQSAFRRPA